MSLDLDIVRTIGRAEIDLEPEVTRVLSESDLERLTTERGVQKPKELSSLSRLSERHRNLAKLIASGVPQWEAAAITGYTQSRVSILLNDSAFRNLVRFYSQENNIIYTTTNERIAQAGLTATDLLMERLEDPEQAEKMSVSQLLEIAKVMHDRSGNGPSATTQVNVTVGLAERLEAARRRVLQNNLIEAKAVEVDGTD